MRLSRIWAIAGVTLILARPAVSLAGEGWEATIGSGLTTAEWIGLAGIVVLFAWGEGVRALGRAWSPWVVRRIRMLDADSPRLHSLLAPLWAVGLVADERAVLLRAWGGAAAIVAAILIVRAIPHPWRGMIELGVAVALLLGVAALLVHYLRTPRTVSPVPEPTPEEGRGLPV